MKKSAKIFFLLLIVTLAGCDKWDNTSDISHVTYLPEFEFSGGEFMSFVNSETKFKDPGVKATSQGEILNVYIINPDAIPDSLNEPGIFVIYYYAENNEGFSKTANRVIAVTYDDVTNNDLSGTYATNIFGEVVISRIKKTDDKGLYKCEEVFGYPGASMPGMFADLGENKLALLPGEGYFGKYDISEGSYSRSTLSWTINLLDEPNTGISIPVTWNKIN